jgi:hypothetical protein
MELMMHFPWHHFKPAITISNLDASNMNETLAISGSVTAILTNFCIAQTVQHAIVYIDINHMSPVFDLLLSNIHSSTIVSGHHELLEEDSTGYAASLSNIQERQSKMIDDDPN